MCIDHSHLIFVYDTSGSLHVVFEGTICVEKAAIHFALRQKEISWYENLFEWCAVNPLTAVGTRSSLPTLASQRMCVSRERMGNSPWRILSISVVTSHSSTIEDHTFANLRSGSADEMQDEGMSVGWRRDLLWRRSVPPVSSKPCKRHIRASNEETHWRNICLEQVNLVSVLKHFCKLWILPVDGFLERTTLFFRIGQKNHIFVELRRQRTARFIFCVALRRRRVMIDTDVGGDHT